MMFCYSGWKFLKYEDTLNIFIKYYLSLLNIIEEIKLCYTSSEKEKKEGW